MAQHSCTNIVQNAWNGGWYTFGSGSYWAGFANNPDRVWYYTTVIAFTTPDFSGVSEWVSINYSAKKEYSNGDPVLRYALCVPAAGETFDSFKDNYVGHGNSVSDFRAIASGEKTHGGAQKYYSLWNLTFSSQDLKPNTTYYLFLWAKYTGSKYSSYMRINAPSAHSVTLGVQDGLARIRVGGSWQKAQVWVRWGGSWKKARPWVRWNGSWKNTC